MSKYLEAAKDYNAQDAIRSIEEHRAATAKEDAKQYTSAEKKLKAAGLTPEDLEALGFARRK